MFLSRAADIRPVQIGRSYRRSGPGSAKEIADVDGLLDDRSGIPHVQFMVRIERQHSTHKAGLRTLSVTSFLKYYNERI